MLSRAKSHYASASPMPAMLCMYTCRARGGRLSRDVKAICRRSRRVGARQHEMCERETEIVREMSLSVAKALDECQRQFRDRHWNCSLEQRRLAAKLLKMGLYTHRPEKK